MKLAAWAYTTPAATRTRNQDRALVADRILERTTELEHQTLEPPVLIGVFDGLGGHPAGDVASELAAAVVSDATVPGGPDEASALLEQAHNSLLEAAVRDTHLTGMGTTAVLAIAGEDEVLVANVGDSTAWQRSGDDIAELSDSDRSGFGLTQCLGGYDHDAAITVHTRSAPLHAGDRLLLASDGLSDVVPAQWITAALELDEPTTALRRLIEAVEESGRPDDLTIVLVEVVG